MDYSIFVLVLGGRDYRRQNIPGIILVYKRYILPIG